MSDKIERCPVCGSDMDEYCAGENDRTLWYECMSHMCQFACNAGDLPLISAAMEFARARAAYAYAPGSIGDDEQQELWDEVTGTTKRVLEVFK